MKMEQNDREKVMEAAAAKGLTTIYLMSRQKISFREALCCLLFSLTSFSFVIGECAKDATNTFYVTNMNIWCSNTYNANQLSFKRFDHFQNIFWHTLWPNRIFLTQVISVTYRENSFTFRETFPYPFRSPLQSSAVKKKHIQMARFWNIHKHGKFTYSHFLSTSHSQETVQPETLSKCASNS